MHFLFFARNWLRTLALVTIFGPLLQATAAEKPLRAGVAAVDITPDFPVRLNGFGGRRTESEGVTLPIWAKAIAIDDPAEGPAILITTDNLCVPGDVTEEVARRLKNKIDLKAERLTVTATHSHTAPMLKNAAPTIFGVPIPPEHQKNIDRYTAEFIDKLEAVALAAVKDIRPAQLSWATGTIGFSMNRRPGGGPVDHDLPVLAIRDLNGKLRALYFSYACHCVTLSNNKVSGDWAGFAQKKIQELFPGSIALASVGCGADSNPNSGVTGANVKVCEDQGGQVAREIKRLIESDLMQPITHRPTLHYARIDLDLAPARTRAEWEERAKRADAIGYHAQVNLARLDRGETLPTKLNYPVQSWIFGNELALVFLPGETVVDYSLRLKREFDHARLWVNGYANDARCYIPSERILKEGGYEGGDAMVYYDVPQKFAPGLEQKIINAVHAQIPKSFQTVKGTDGIPSLSPAQALKSIRTKPGFTVELVACEPLIVDPVAIDFGADGKLWVVEMHDYPAGMDGNYKPGGRVKFLEDTNRDGTFDKATTFLGDLPFPTGVMVWRKGVLICAAPDILYAEDTDNDGRADKIEKLFSGFVTENYQARVNGLSYGLDNWIYGANGLLGGSIRGSFSGKTVDIRGRDFRMNPDTGAFEPAAGITQQGRIRDDWGNWFGSDNSSLAWHYPMPEHYLRRNPNVISPEQRVYVPTGPEHNHVHPASKTLTRFNEPGSANKATSVCGGTIYRDNLLGEDFAGDYFADEPVHNLVTRLKLQPNGVTFSGHRASDEQNSEFFASTDNWSRPVQVRTGPDGALWIVDMYRFVIEHPRWITAERLATLDVRAGADKGRIYRVFPKGKTLRPVRDLTKLSPAELVAALDTPNGVQRDLIQAQLVQAGDKSVATALGKLAQKTQWPQVRVQALWTAQGLGVLQPEWLQRALGDDNAEVRRNAIRLSEPFLKNTTALANAALALVDDPEEIVRYQLAFSLGEWNNAKAGDALGRLALKNMGDPWMRTAILSSSLSNPGEILEVILTSAPEVAGRGELIGGLISSAVASGDESTMGKVLAALASSQTDAPQAWRFSSLANLVDALERRHLKLAQVLQESSSENHGIAAKLETLFKQAGKVAFDGNAAPELREPALRVFGLRPGLDTEDLKHILALLDSDAAPSLKTAALNALRRNSNPQLASLLLHDWSHRSPGTRASFVELLLTRQESSAQLLGALEDGTIASAEISIPNRERLLKSDNAALRNRAEKVFAAFRPKGRVEVLAAYKSVAELQGDSDRGAEVFKANCSTCHFVRGIGHAVGPDITLFRDKGVTEFIEAILDPNAVIEPRFINYNIELKDDRSLSGVVANESANSLTLVQAGDVREAILRSEIKEIRASALSLMPEGFEQAINHQNMADLIAFLKGGAPRPFGSSTAESSAAARAGFQNSKPNGVAKITTASEVIDYTSWLGVLTFAHCRQTDGNARLVWQTAAVPKTFKATEREAFRFAGGLGHFTQPTGKFDLKLNGKKVLEFGVVLEDHVWSSPDGAVKMSYQVKENSAEDSNGIFTIDVAGALLKPGEPATFEVTGSAANSLRWFGIYLPSRELLALEKSDENSDNLSLAQRLLQDGIPASERGAIIQNNPGRSAEFLTEMTADLNAGTKEEYRRIPWIWRVAIAAGKRNDADEIRRLLDVSLPQTGAPLLDWQAVVIGGGLINGISQTDTWPGERIDTIFGNDNALRERWNRALELASEMADNEKVRNGTRYDALRMVALRPWKDSRQQLSKYLGKTVNGELQQGAVSGLVDVNDPEAANLLVEHINELTKGNVNFALDGLLRSPDRTAILRRAIADGKIAPALLGAQRMEILSNAQRSSAK